MLIAFEPSSKATTSSIGHSLPSPLFRETRLLLFILWIEGRPSVTVRLSAYIDLSFPELISRIKVFLISCQYGLFQQDPADLSSLLHPLSQAIPPSSVEDLSHLSEFSLVLLVLFRRLLCEHSFEFDNVP